MNLKIKILTILFFVLILNTACSKKMDVSEIKYDNTKISINNKTLNNSNDQVFEILENKTKYVRESTDDAPLSVSNLNIINFIHNDNEIKIYLYKDNDKFYLERAYVGVWEIDKDNYEKLVNMEE